MQQRATVEADARNEELARKLAEATLAQVKAQIEDDLELLKKRLPDGNTLATQAALDVKYIRERQE